MDIVDTDKGLQRTHSFERSLSGDDIDTDTTKKDDGHDDTTKKEPTGGSDKNTATHKDQDEEKGKAEEYSDNNEKVIGEDKAQEDKAHQRAMIDSLRAAQRAVQSFQLARPNPQDSKNAADWQKLVDAGYYISSGDTYRCKGCMQVNVSLHFDQPPYRNYEVCQAT